MHKQVTVHAKKSSGKAKKSKHKIHHVEIHPIENGLKVMSHFQPPDAPADNPGAYMPSPDPEEHGFSGPTAGADAMSHASSVLGVGQAAPDSGAPAKPEPDGDEA